LDVIVVQMVCSLFIATDCNTSQLSVRGNLTSLIGCDVKRNCTMRMRAQPVFIISHSRAQLLLIWPHNVVQLEQRNDEGGPVFEKN